VVRVVRRMTDRPDRPDQVIRFPLRQPALQIRSADILLLAPLRFVF
jgi:hypothetical protein